MISELVLYQSWIGFYLPISINKVDAEAEPKSFFIVLLYRLCFSFFLLLEKATKQVTMIFANLIVILARSISEDAYSVGKLGSFFQVFVHRTDERQSHSWHFDALCHFVFVKMKTTTVLSGRTS